MLQSCDASLLLDSTRRMLSEKETDRSFGMRNFRYIETIKEALERECPGVVSCSDILVLSARDGIVSVSKSSLYSRFLKMSCFFSTLQNQNQYCQIPLVYYVSLTGFAFCMYISDNDAKVLQVFHVLTSSMELFEVKNKATLVVDSNPCLFPFNRRVPRTETSCFYVSVSFKNLAQYHKTHDAHWNLESVCSLEGHTSLLKLEEEMAEKAEQIYSNNTSQTTMRA